MSSYRFPRIRSTEITPEEVWQSRRHWMKATGATFATGALGGWSALASAAALAKLDAQRLTSGFGAGELFHPCVFGNEFFAAPLSHSQRFEDTVGHGMSNRDVL